MYLRDALKLQLDQSLQFTLRDYLLSDNLHTPGTARAFDDSDQTPRFGYHVAIGSASWRLPGHEADSNLVVNHKCY